MRQVEISFLMVGHTHEAVDRFFSFINRCLKNKTYTMTTEEMIEFVTHYLAEGTVMEFNDLEFVADWKTWCNGCYEEVHDHTGKGSPLHFKFARDEEDGDVVMRYRHLCDEDWVPRSGLEIIRKDPEDVRPQPANYKFFSENEGYLKGLQKTVVKLKATDFLDERSRAWWENLLKEKALDVVPKQYLYDSKFNVKFPKLADGQPGARSSVADRDEESEELREHDYTEKEMEDFGFSRRKEPYVGKYESRKKRNQHGCNVAEELKLGSFTMLRSRDKTEPLLFGFVTEILEGKKFVMHYCLRKIGKEDLPLTSLDISCKFYKVFQRNGKKASPWVGTHHSDEVLLFDIDCCGLSKTGLFNVTKRGQKRMIESIDDLGNLGASDSSSGSDSDEGEEGSDEGESGAESEREDHSSSDD